MKKSVSPVIGVLALQGAVQPHKTHTEEAGAQFKAVKTAADFDCVDGFILPGGESTVMLKLIERFGLWDTLVQQFKTKPVWGICAGCILLAETVQNPAQKSFGLLPVTVQRNGYGRQLDSTHAQIHGYTVSFIRAPVITQIHESVEVLAEHKNDPVWIKKDLAMASTFHPELTHDTPSPMHQLFIDLVRTRI